MTLTLELPPEAEARLREIARAQPRHRRSHGVGARQWMREQSAMANEEAKARGCMKDMGLSSDDFLRERHAEAQSELEKDEARSREREARTEEIA